MLYVFPGYPAPFPAPTPTVAPRLAAQEAASALGRAFAARDAEAVARVMPECRISVVYAIDGVTPGQGGLGRSVSLFTQGLRERFAAGDLTVTVDTALQPDPETGREAYFVRSEWREPDRTVRIDLFLEQRDGRGVWHSARQHFSRSEISGSGCVPYRSPWVRSDSSC